MIREWMSQDGTIAQYDTVTKWIQYLDSTTRVNLVVPRLALPEEIAEYRNLFPDVSAEERAAMQTVKSALSDARSFINDTLANRASTTVDMRNAINAFQDAMAIYRQSEYGDDPELLRLVNLVTAATIRVIKNMLLIILDGMEDVTNQNAFIQLQNEQLDVRVSALEAYNVSNP